MSNVTNINISMSDTAVKWVVGGAVALGALWLIRELFKDENLELPQEAQTFSQLPGLQPAEFNDIQYAPEITKAVAPIYNAGEYSDAVFKASKCLFDVIRDRSGITDADGTQLVDRAFAKDGPLKFENVSEPHIQNIGSGLTDGLRFIAKFCRRIPAHSNQPFPPHAALIQINLICWFAQIIEQNTSVTLATISVQVGGSAA